jgi:O-methyltransferase
LPNARGANDPKKGTGMSSLDCCERYFELLARALTASLHPQSSDWLVQGSNDGRIRSRFKRGMIAAITKRGFKLYRSVPYDAAKREVGGDWPGIGYSMIGLKRIRNVRQLTQTILDDEVPGDLIECGVWRGGAAMMMKAVLAIAGSDRTLWLADSFEGLPAPSVPQDEGYDLSSMPYLSAGEQLVRENFARFDLLDERVRFLPGWFKDTLPRAPIEQIALLRADADLYESTMDILTNLYDRVAPGGFVIIDDYHGWEPCKRAVTEFRETRSISNPIVEIDGCGVYWRVT